MHSDPSPVRPGSAAPTRQDRRALAAAVVLPALGWALAMSDGGVLFFVLIYAAPLVAALYVWGVVMVVRSLGSRSRLRAAFGVVPRRHRVVAWVWAVALLLPGIVARGVFEDGVRPRSGAAAWLQYLGAPAPYALLFGPLVVLLLRRADLRRVAPRRTAADDGAKAPALTG